MRNGRRLMGIDSWKAVAKCWFLMLAVMTVIGCARDDDETETNTTRTVTYKVAVFLENDDVIRWEKTADWAQRQLDEAQKDMRMHVRLELEYIDQDAPDFDENIDRVANDTTYKAIIGPCSSLKAEQMAIALGDVIESHPGVEAYRKPMVSPSATNVEYQRKFSEKDYVWNLSECDISQIEKIIASVSHQYMSAFVDLTLLAPYDDNDVASGSSYCDWFGFIAEEYGLEIKDILFYKDTTELRSLARKLPGYGNVPMYSKVVFVPQSIDDVLVLDDELDKTTREQDYDNCDYPLIICSSMFVTPKVAKTISCNPRLSYEGIDLYAAPESGFSQAYYQHFGGHLVNGESQFYDAVCMLTFAAALKQYTGRSLGKSMHEMIDGQGGSPVWACYVDGMREVFTQLYKGGKVSIQGCTGEWKFDAKYRTNRLNSIYRQWRFYRGEFVTVNYITSTGSAHSTSSHEVWDWTANKLQDFENIDTVINYKPLEQRWALLVAGSKGWGNYRFQADVLSMYGFLLKRGYDKDHIVVVAEDDLAYNESNKNDKGAVRILETGDNLYDPSFIDYKLSRLTPDDIGDILQGKSSARLPKVIHSTDADNVFVMWSSHGAPRQLDFGDDRMMTYGKMKDILAKTPHRKMLVAVEACYGGGLGKECEGLAGTLFLTAASPYEECHAARWSNRIGIYLTNSFSEGFQERIADNPSISLQELYYSLVRTVSGSHVKLYNLKNYGSIYSDTMEDYLE